MSNTTSQAIPAPGPVPVAQIPKKEPKKAIKKQAKGERPKPTRNLPTDRVNPSKQLDILRAYAAASNLGTKAATVNEIADLMKMAPATVAMVHPFFVSVGLLQRSDTAAYAPSPDVITFLRAYEWNAETASYKLAGPMRDAWFGQAIMGRITFKPIDEDAAITALAEACGASREYRSQLKTILELMALCGVIQREGGQIRLPKGSNQSDASAPDTNRETAPDQEPKGAARVNTAYAGSEGGVQFGVNVNVDMKEFGTWRPERIAAFFSGIAQVLAAKANVEKGGGSQGS